MTLSTPPIENLVSVVIVNYKSWGKLSACLSSLLALDCPSITLEIIVVDNQSGGEELIAFTHQYPQVRWIENSGNYGFANGCNTGANSATGQYLLFLNPDTEVHEDIFSPLKHCLDGLPSYSIVATQKHSEKGKPERIERFFPRWYTLTGLGKALHRKINKQTIAEQFTSSQPLVFPDWVSGSVVFMTRKDWLALNGWNEQFWMYSEDVDLCQRATAKGGRIALLQHAVTVHNHGGSSRINPVTSALTKSEVFISRHVYISLHFSARSRALIQLTLAMKSLLKTGIIALLSLLIATHPKAQASRKLFTNLVAYYWHAIKHETWLSPRSVVYKNKLDAD